MMIDTHDLNEQEFIQLRKLLKDARFYDLAQAKTEVLPQSKDAFRYKITVKKPDHTSCSVLTADPVSDPHLRELIQWIRKISTKTAS